MLRPVLALGLLPVLFVACNGKSSSAPPGDDGGTGEGGLTSITYTPQGCQYSYTPPATLAYQDLALDATHGARGPHQRCP